jgi:hypothetical protein
LIPQIFDVAVSPESRVIRQVPANVIRIVVDYNVVRAPVPVAAQVNVVRCNAEIESAKPESRSIPAFDPVDMSAANFTREVAVLPRSSKFVVRIVPACVMPYPLIRLGMNVRRLGMRGCIVVLHARVICWCATAWRRCRTGMGRRPARRNVTTANFRSAEVIRRRSNMRCGRSRPRRWCAAAPLSPASLLSKSSLENRRQR